jgi:glutamate dehydrogenase/leucine dehydrogenase
VGVSLEVEDERYVPKGSKYRVADMITGYGVAESVIHFYELKGESIKGKKVLVQGWGNVGAAAGYYLSQAGGIVTGIIDRAGGVISENGFTHDEVVKLFHSRTTNMFEGFEKVSDINEQFWNLKADVFIPAAASRLVTLDQVSALTDNGLQVIACGANVPFADPEIFFGAISRYADHHVSVIPDFISNCGMARVFAYLMSNPAKYDAEGIFSDVAATIHKALDDIHAVHQGKTDITARAYEIALKQLV